MQQTHPGGQYEQGEQVGRVGAGVVVPPFEQAHVGAELPCQFPPGQPGGHSEALQSLGKVLGERDRLHPIDLLLASH